MRAELPIVSFICTILVLIPLPWHWKARNVATLSIIVWLALCNIIRGINALVWAGSVVVKYPVWCDISEWFHTDASYPSDRFSATKIVIGANIGLPASTLCICRYLSVVASPRHSMANASDKRRRMIFELLMTAGFPLIFMALRKFSFLVQRPKLTARADYIVQGHRFDILEDFGCNPVSPVCPAVVFKPLTHT
jgi:pheromone a factor receptor